MKVLKDEVRRQQHEELDAILAMFPPMRSPHTRLGAWLRRLFPSRARTLLLAAIARKLLTLLRDAERRLDELDDWADYVENKNSPDENEFTELGGQIEKLQGALDTACEELTELRDKVDDLESTEAA